MTVYTCPVCGCAELEEEPTPTSYEICPQCGVEFGYDDANTLYDVLREGWIAAGRPFWSTRAVGDPAWNEWYHGILHSTEEGHQGATTRRR